MSRRSALLAGGTTMLAAFARGHVAQAATQVPTTGGATTWLNVRAYGAQGDGVTDDTAAITAACNAARALPGSGDAVAVVYLPTGIYRISSTINVWNVFMKGDGQGSTRIIASHDWATGGPNTSWALDQQPSNGPGGGVGLPAPSASYVGVAPNEGTWIEDLWVNGPGGIVAGQVPCHLSGVRVGNGAGYSRLRIDGFYAGAFLFSDHEKLIGPGEQGGNYYGVYFGEPSQSSGDQIIMDITLDGAAWASIGVSTNRSIGGVAMRKLHLGTAPFGIYKEECSDGLIMGGSVLSNVAFESCGNGNIFVNGPGGGGASVENCVFDVGGSTNALDPGRQIPLSTTDVFGRAIGRMNAPIDLGTGDWMGNEVLGVDVALPKPGVTNYSALFACGLFTGGRYGPGEQALQRVNGDGKLFTSGSNSGDALIMSYATACRLLRTNGNGMLLGDLVESSGGGQPGCQRSTATRIAMGVAMHPANNAQSVAVAYSGLVGIRCGTNTISANDPLVADPTQIGCVKTAPSPMTVGIVGVAQNPSSNGTVIAILQGH